MSLKNKSGLANGIARDAVIAEALALLLIFFLQKTPSIV
jgi:hypothetical protein